MWNDLQDADRVRLEQTQCHDCKRYYDLKVSTLMGSAYYYNWSNFTHTENTQLQLMLFFPLSAPLGALSAVGSLEITTASTNSINTTSVVSLNWTAPFTLDVFATVIDITYCVDVISHASSLLLHSECWDTNVTGFEYHPSPTDVCEDIVFVVIPRNRVGNGTSNSIHYSQSFMRECIYTILCCICFYCLVVVVVVAIVVAAPELATGQEIALSGTSDRENGVTFTVSMVRAHTSIVAEWSYKSGTNPLTDPPSYIIISKAKFHSKCMAVEIIMSDCMRGDQ